MCLVSKNDVVRVIRLLRRRKAPGLDVITSHYLQALLIEHMTLSFQMCIDTGQVCNFLGSGAIKNIKKKGKMPIFVVVITPQPQFPTWKILQRTPAPFCP